jgi:hypothetical protein
MLAVLRLNFVYEIGQSVRGQLALQAIGDTCVVDPFHIRKACYQGLYRLDACRGLEQDGLAARVPCHIACRHGLLFIIQLVPRGSAIKVFDHPQSTGVKKLTASQFGDIYIFLSPAAPAIYNRHSQQH